MRWNLRLLVNGVAAGFLMLAYQNCGQFGSSGVRTFPSSDVQQDFGSAEIVADDAFKLVSLTSGAAQLEAIFPKPVKLHILFGLDENYGQSTPKEDSFDYSTHLQTLAPLSPSTEYHYRVIAEDQDGVTYTSNNLTFTTPDGLAPPPPTENPTWMAAQESEHYDENKPYSGIFVGVANGGFYGAGNTTMAAEHSVRFRAPKTGVLDRFSYQNRYLTKETIAARVASQNVYLPCTQSPGGALYDGVIDGNPRLAAARCGFVVGNGYLSGSGGELVFEVWPNDPATGHPDKSAGTPLGTSDPENGFVPIDFAQGRFFEFELTTPAAVAAGELYHVVIRNKKLPPGGKCNGYTAAQAMALPNDVGCIALNGLVHGVTPDITKNRGPYFANHETLYKRTPGSEWTSSGSNTVGWWRARYNDTTWIGEQYASFDAFNVGTTVIGGNTRLRNRFVSQTDTRVNGVWINHGQLGNSNGQSLTVELKNSSGTILATGSIASNTELKNVFSTQSVWRRNARAWSYGDLSTTVPLTQGETYTIELSSAAGAGFSMNAMAWVFGSSPAANSYINQQLVAEKSTNGGSTWGLPTTSLFGDTRQFNILMTVEGMPKQINDNNKAPDVEIYL